MTQQSLITRLKAMEEALEFGAVSLDDYAKKQGADHSAVADVLRLNLSDLRELIKEAEGQSAVYVIPERCINDIQANSISTMIARAKHAHYCNIYLRINGKDELYEADWVKHMTALGEKP